MLPTNHTSVDEATSALERATDRVGPVVAALGAEAKRILKERPGTVLLAALAVGFAVGRLLSRR
jgi:hypothetical protein